MKFQNSSNAKTRASTLEKNIMSRKRHSFSINSVFRKSLKTLKILPIIFLIIGILYGIYYFVFSSSFFKIKKIDIVGTYKFVNSTDINNLASSVALGKNNLFFNSVALSTTLQKNYLGAKSIKVTKKMPDKLTISVYERTPLAIVYNDASADHYIVDEDGYVLGLVQDSFMSLPQIHYEGDILIGKFLDINVIPVASEIIKEADYESLKISSISVHPRRIEIFVNSTTKVILSKDKDITQSIKAINPAILNSKEQNKELKELDLRYDKVYVSYY